MIRNNEPLGVRLNNPGNIRYVESVKWQGLDDPPQENGFCRFKSPTYGIRAIARQLITYFDRDDCNTVRQMISKWAPPSENPTEKYIANVASWMKVGADDALNAHDYKTLRGLVLGIIRQENGQQPYKDTVIDKALVLAGVEPDKQPLVKTRTVTGASLTATAVGLNEIVSDAKDQLEPLIDYADAMKYLFLFVALMGVALTLYARIDDRRKGIN